MIAGPRRNGTVAPSLHALKPVHFFLPLALGALLAGCRKDELFTGSGSVELAFTQDTIFFDTVFTTIGTVTKRFTARNPASEGVRVDIDLEGGSPSPFRINVDGSSGLSFQDVEIAGGDSIYVFVEATLGPGGVNTPFVLEDHIRFQVNGNQQLVTLNAWGQDAHFFRPDQAVQGFPPFSYIAGGFDSLGNQICETVHWANDKPYVIYGYGVVDSCCTLIIDPGVRVYFHGGGGLWVYRGGRIQAEGTYQEHITFQGDRREAEYADLPGQWDRIWINDGPADQVFNHVDIKNALVGIQPQSWIGVPGQPTSANTLVLNNVSIRNCSAAGILSENYRIRSTNLLVTNCGQYGVLLTGGGQYDFNHATVANYWSYDVREEPAFVLTNSFTDINGATQVRQVESSHFLNSIIYGGNTNEFLLAEDPGAMVDCLFSYCLLRTDQNTTGSHFDVSTIYRNIEPGFADAGAGNLHIGASSFVVGKGIVDGSDPVSFNDLDGVFRTTPDLGCYTVVP